jgi:predicted nucleic acid-binding protein
LGKLVSFDKLDKTNTPTKIILDTNFILNLTNRFTNHPTNRNITDCSNFTKSLVYANTEIFIPDVVVNEFCCQVFTTILLEYRKKNNLTKHILNIHRDNPRIIRPGHEKISKAIKDLDLIRSKKKLLENGEGVRNKALKLMRKYDLLPSDAYISAIAIVNQINNIATLDVPLTKSLLKEEINIYTPFTEINLS